MALLARHTIDHRGTLRPGGEQSSRAAQLREEISWVAVPMGKCSEPTNVRAGGQACPIRSQCAGCPHFESDPSYLPELLGYADELRKEREVLIAFGAAEWVITNVTGQLEVIVDHIGRHDALLGRSASTTETPSRRPPAPCARCASPSPLRSGADTAPPMADNSAALARARRQDSRTKRIRARQALQEMIDTGQRITFAAVARHAGVSVSLVYADADLAALVAEARDRQQQAGLRRSWGLPARSLVTEQSLRADLANAKEQVRQLHDENSVLRQRLARNLGADADAARGRAVAPLLDQLEDRATELEADNHRLRRRIAALETELHDTVDSLQAARAANRDLMNMISR